MRLVCSILLFFATKIALTAQIDSLPNWETDKESIFSIRYPTTTWSKTNELSARFCLATKATEAKAYDRYKSLKLVVSY